MKFVYLFLMAALCNAFGFEYAFAAQQPGDRAISSKSSRSSWVPVWVVNAGAAVKKGLTSCKEAVVKGAIWCKEGFINLKNLATGKECLDVGADDFSDESIQPLSKDKDKQD